MTIHPKARDLERRLRRLGTRPTGDKLIIARQELENCRISIDMLRVMIEKYGLVAESDLVMTAIIVTRKPKSGDAFAAKAMGYTP